MKLTFIKRSLVAISAFLLIVSCSRDIDELEPAQYPNNPNVFIDAFSAGLNYAAFSGSVPAAFQVDTEVTIENSEASMRFEVPDANDPRGAYAGGAFFTEIGRNLTEYDALTFWMKASMACNIDIIGFGNDLGESLNQASVNAIAATTNWKKVVIPIPNPEVLTQEKGLLFYSAGPIDGRGYTFWLDDVKFEKLGTIAHGKATILDGEDVTQSPGVGSTIQITGLISTFNLPTGVNRTLDTGPGYFTFTSSDTSVASVDQRGLVTVKDLGEAVITAELGSVEVEGSLIISSDGIPGGPSTVSPTPAFPADAVISMFSNAYENVPIDTWNTRWEFSTADEFFLNIQGSDVIRYRNLNFVGIEFASSTIDASGMTNFHMNLFTPENTDPPAAFNILLVDFGPDGEFGGGDDSSHEITITSPTLASDEWITIDIPLSEFSGLQSRANLAQLVLSGDLSDIYIDNVLFYDDGSGSGGGDPETPDAAAPAPTIDANQVKSIFSDAYDNVPGTDFFPDWGQATVVTQVNIGGSNTLRYGNLNYQGTQLASSIDVSDMDFLHLDFWTANSTSLEVSLISPGPNETPFSLVVPTSGWVSVDIPLSEFSGVDIADVFQFKFEGNGNVYLDNIFFHKQ